MDGAERKRQLGRRWRVGEGWITSTPDRPKWTARSGGEARREGKCVVQMVRWGYVVLPVPWPTFARRVRGTGFQWGVFTFSFALPFAFALAFSFSFALGRGADGMWEVGVTIKERGRRRPGGATSWGGFCREAGWDASAPHALLEPVALVHFALLGSNALTAGPLSSLHVKFIHTKIPWNLENLNSTRNPQVR